MNIEKVILKNLLTNEQYVRKTLPYLNSELFPEKSERIVFDELSSYINKYNSPPSKEALQITISNSSSISEEEFNEAIELVDALFKDKDTSDQKWLIDETEKFCKDRALHNAIMESIHIMDGTDTNRGKGMITKIISDALGVSFDPNVGHDFLDDAESRYDFYHQKEERIPFHLEYFNRITKGGLPAKTLNIILAGTNVGKSLFMCDFAANCLLQQKNVLYITLEMAEERIAERIDANLLDVSLDTLQDLPREDFVRKMGRLKEKVKGKLIIKEYPTASAGASHFKALLNELQLKKKFKPDIVFIDYLNICNSSRIKMGSNVNSYSYVKAIAEELRGLAVEFNVPIVSATQMNRSGFSSSDPDLTDTSESFGLPMTADFMFCLTTDEELEKINQIMVKQLKNRYSDVSRNKRFMVGIDKSKMRLYDLDEKQQKTIQDTNNTSDKDYKPTPPPSGGYASKFRGKSDLKV